MGFGMIDWSRVKELQSEIGEEDFAEVAELFLEEADEAITRLRQHGNAAARQADLHFLKGSALNLGFSDLARLCHDGERACADGTPCDTEAVAQSYVAARAAFLQATRQRSAA